MGLVNLDIEPSTQIERKAKRNGKDELPDDLIDPKSIKISKND
jgi:hypothetical protein|tara:strand:- start:1078 stop:1206 length:129 start_codon:yes stop_codon:yes gene_type:complete